LTLRAIYPGSFDPITNGHLDLVNRGLKIFEELTIAVADSPEKQTLFTAQERMEMVRESVGERSRCKVELFDSLLIEYATMKGIKVILRGLRAVSDFEYELQIALTNRKLNEEIETVFMMPSKDYIYLSSRLVREIARYGGPVEEFVPSCVADNLQRLFPAAAT
jgi:pantetheine-phosphate adenylyltransferase